MANHPGDINDPFTYQNERTADKTSLLPSVRNLPSVRATGVSRCPNCGAPLPPGTSVCPECGEFLREKVKRIRCRRCGQRASSSLTICPHCGRELIAAPARLLTWGAPVVLVGLFLVVLVGRSYKGNPVTWLQTRIGAGMSWVGKLGDSVAPSVNVSTEQMTGTPISLTINLGRQDNQASVGVSQVVTTTEPTTAPTTAPPPTAMMTPTLAVAAFATDTPTLAPTATPPPTATPLPTASATPTPVATATSTAVITSTTSSVVQSALVLVPTAAATGAVPPLTIKTGLGVNKQGEGTTAPSGAAKATATAVATKTVAPTSTPTTAPPTATVAPSPTSPSVAQKTYTIQAGDTLNQIAARFGIDNQSLMEANGLTTEDIYRLHPGQTLIIPTDSATASPPPKASSTARTYTIQSGDTPFEIASAFGISVAELLAANHLSNDDARNLRVGQVLVIPGGNQSDNQADQQPSPTPTPTGSSPATAQPAAATPAAQAKLRLDAPRLRSPENNTSVSCSSSNSLVWQSEAFMLDTDRFVLHLGFVNGHNASGDESVAWVLEQFQASGNTSWSMDNSLCALAPQNLGRQWRWYVEVIDANHNVVSSPSAIWGFSWN